MPLVDVSSVPDGIWTPYEPTYVGFSANPSGGICRYTTIGKTCIMAHNRSPGTSNATTFTITIPFASFDVYYYAIRFQNNGTFSTSPGEAVVFNTSNTVIDLFRDFAGATWTASGSKNAFFTVIYEMA